MATLQYQEPKLFIAENQKAPLVRYAPQAAGHTGNAIIRRGDFVQIAAGALSRCATNQALNVYGLAIHGEVNEFTSGTPSFGLDYSGALFGPTQVTTATSAGLLPSEPGTVHVNSAILSQLFEISATNITGWVTGGTNQVNIGSVGGLNLDAGTNLFLFDPTQVNKILTVYAVSTRAGVGGAGLGGATAPGDVAPLLLCYFNGGTV